MLHIKTLLIAAPVALGLLGAPAAHADWRHGGGGHWGGGGGGHWGGGGGYRGGGGWGHHRGGNGALTGALLGLGAAAVIGGIIASQPRYYAPPPVVYAPRPSYYAPTYAQPYYPGYSQYPGYSD